MTFSKDKKYLLSRKPKVSIFWLNFIATYGTNTTSLRGTQVCQDISQDIEKSDSLKLFWPNMKTYRILFCHCKVYKIFVPCVDVWTLLIVLVLIKSF